METSSKGFGASKTPLSALAGFHTFFNLSDPQRLRLYIGVHRGAVQKAVTTGAVPRDGRSVRGGPGHELHGNTWASGTEATSDVGETRSRCCGLYWEPQSAHRTGHTPSAVTGGQRC